MAVYTTVETDQLDRFLKAYPVGDARSLQPIAAGITNTNYYLETVQGRFVLTLYENLGGEDLDYILGLQQQLSTNGVRCVCPIADRNGNLRSCLHNRPAVIYPRIEGKVATNPTELDCHVIGEELARFHLSGSGYPGIRPNPRGLLWWHQASRLLKRHLSDDDQKLIKVTITDYEQQPISRLPGGSIHADLFHDNALFDHHKLGAIIDFDYACQDNFVYDLAITMNDWCIDGSGELVDCLVRSLMTGYERERRLLDIERHALPSMLRVSALRFWLSRLYDKVLPQSGYLTHIKCPQEYRRLLLSRQIGSRSLQTLGY